MSSSPPLDSILWHSKFRDRMWHGQLSRFQIHRIIILFVGNMLLLLAIRFLIKKGGSFGEVLSHAGPNVSPVVLAGLGLTGIIFTGAIDLSIASIIAAAGTVFGILVDREVNPIFCFVGCFLTAWI